MSKILLEHTIRGLFIANMKRLRKENKYTQARFAEHLGIEQKRVGGWEEQRSFPPIEMLIQIADLFGKDLKDMLTKEL